MDKSRIFSVPTFRINEILSFDFSAGFLSQASKNQYLKIVIYIMAVAIPVYLVVREPDLGTAITTIVMTIVAMLVSGVPRKILIGGLVAILLLSPVVYLRLKPYQKERVVSFINPAADPLGSGYNVSQSKIAVGSGGLMGKGFGGATQSQLRFLPVAQIDFIFSGWAEATGFVGSIVMIIAFAILIARIFIVSITSRDKFGMIIAAGAGSIIFFQAFVNIGMNIGIMPVTGIPLPFVSYGGTSFLINSALIGMVQSIYLRRKALKFA